MQPSESSLNYFGFLKVFLVLPLPLSLDSVFLVANASAPYSSFSKVLDHVMASCVTLVRALVSLVILVEFDIPVFVAVLFTLMPCCY